MKKQAGLWIDHRKAVIVIVTETGEEIMEVTSDMERHTRFPGRPGSDIGSTEDIRDRQIGNDLNTYYEKVADVIRDADTIQIFGPGGAKGELKKLLEHEGLKGQILAVEAMDKMTDRQIAAKVREHFQE
jgi:hypothetical protein